MQLSEVNMKKLRKKSGLFILGAIIIIIFSVFIYERNYRISHPQLTSKQKIEDFDYMYNILKDNYPYFEVNKRLYGVDWLSKKQEYEKQILRTRNDKGFVKALNKIIKELNSGHTDVLSGDFYEMMVKVYSQHDGYEQWLKVLKDSKVIKRYKGSSNTKSLNQDNGTLGEDKPCYETNIIIPNKVAYINIYSFNGLRTKKDRQGIYDFLRSVKDYPKLIIDIRGNGGGDDGYWMNDIVSPLISKKLTARYYELFRGGEYEMPFLRSRKIKLSNMSSLDGSIIKSFPPESNQFKYYSYEDFTVVPDNSLDYRGKIYLLIDKQDFSASDAFASFSKVTGFAKLIGERTSGDGISIDPIVFSLPNSGIVIRFPANMGLNPNGESNAEKRTSPDITVDAVQRRDYEFDYAIQAAIKD